MDWTPWVAYERLPAELHAAGCALGIFGTSAKAGRVIPNKAFQALACGTPLVTADTPGARELLADGVSALLVPPGDPEALAAALRKLAADGALAERIGGRGQPSTASRRARTSSVRAGAPSWKRCESAGRPLGGDRVRSPPASRRSPSSATRRSTPAASTWATWPRWSGRPRTATRCG